MGKKHLLIDADPATGVKFRDIDDGLAILLVLAAPDIVIEGITINYGNVSANRGYIVAQELLRVVDAEIPLYKGAQSKTELGVTNPAVAFMLDKVNSNPGEISLLALAPLTNVATAMLLDPGFASNLKELVVMGGALDFKPFSYFGEFNFHKDGRAASIVMAAPVPKTLITMDLCSQAVFREEHLQIIKNHDSAVARYLAANIPHWLKLNKPFTRKGGFFPWDVVAAAFLIESSLFEENLCSFKVEEKGIRSGRVLDYKAHERADDYNPDLIINVPLKLRAEAFMELFINSLLSL